METTAATPRPQRGDQLELRVDSLAFGGNGVARTDGGYVVFVNGGVPGDLVRAEITKRKRAYAEARAVEILEPSPERIAPRADHPGAPWQVLPYERQLEVKHAQVAEALRRIGHLDVEVEPIVPAVQEGRYRNKAEFSFGMGPDGALELGFHPPGRWYEVAPMSECLLVSERADAARRAALEWARGQGLSAFDRRSHEGLLRNLVVREGRRTGQLQVRLVIGDGDLDTESLARVLDTDALFITRTDALAETTAGGETELVAGAAELDEEVAGLRFRVSPEAFFQTNTEMAERLYGVAAERAALTGLERVCDLFGGTGPIPRTLTPRAGEVWGLDLVEPPIADAISNARLNEVAN